MMNIATRDIMQGADQRDDQPVKRDAESSRPRRLSRRLEFQRDELPSGRSRTMLEQLFTEALIIELDFERNRRALDQRGFALFLGVHESLLSHYRSGLRFPSVSGFIEIEQKLPGLWLRVVQRYYRLCREEDEAARLYAEALAREESDRQSKDGGAHPSQ